MLLPNKFKSISLLYARLQKSGGVSKWSTFFHNMLKIIAVR